MSPSSSFSFIYVLLLSIQLVPGGRERERGLYSIHVLRILFIFLLFPIGLLVYLAIDDQPVDGVDPLRIVKRRVVLACHVVVDSRLGAHGHCWFLKTVVHIGARSNHILDGQRLCIYDAI